MVLNKTTLKLVAVIQLALILFCNCTFYNSYLSFANADKLPVNKCRFNTLAEAVASVSSGMLTDPQPIYAEVLACVELYSNTYYMSVNPLKKIDESQGVKIGYGLDLSATGDFGDTTSNFSLLKNVGEDAYIKLAKADDAAKEFSDDVINKLLLAHNAYFQSLITKILKVNETDNFAALPSTVKFALFLTFYNKYDILSTSDEFTNKTVDILLKKDYQGLADYLKNQTFMPLPRKTVVLALLNSFQTKAVPKLRIAVVLSAAPTVMTKNLKTFLKNALNDLIVDELTNYVEVSIATVSNKNWTLAFNGTGSNVLTGNLTNFNASIDSLSPFDIGEGENANLNATLLNSIVDTAFGKNYSNFDSVQNVVLVFSKTSEFVQADYPTISPKISLYNFNLLGKESVKQVTYPYTFFFKSFDSLVNSSFSLKLSSFCKNSAIRAPVSSFFTDSLTPSNVRYYSFSKNSQNNAIAYIRNVVEDRNQTQTFNANVYASYLNPRPEIQPGSDSFMTTITTGYRLVIKNQVADKYFTGFNRVNGANDTLYLAVKSNSLNASNLLFEFGDCDVTNPECLPGITAIGTVTPQGVFLPGSVTPVPIDPKDSSFGTNFTAVNVVLIIVAAFLVAASVFILAKTPKVENSSSMRALSEMSSK